MVETSIPISDKTNYPAFFIRVKDVVIDSVWLICAMTIATDIFFNMEVLSIWPKIVVFILLFILCSPLLISIFGFTLVHFLMGIRVKKLRTLKRIFYFQLQS